MVVVDHRFPEAAAMMAGIVMQRLLQQGYRMQMVESWPSKPEEEVLEQVRILARAERSRAAAEMAEQGEAA